MRNIEDCPPRPAKLGSSPPAASVPAEAKPVLRAPRVEDGAAIWRLVRDTGVLDLNSPYSYLMLCRDFRDTCVVAERADAARGDLLGFVSAFVPPARADSVFVWQVAVARPGRRLGLGGALLRALLARPACADVAYLEATVTPSNQPSAALFRGLARDFDSPVAVEPCFRASHFPEPAHEAELLFRIGPFSTARFSVTH